MSLREAETLAEAMTRETDTLLQMRQIGNGEWVLLLNGTKFIWDVQDWERVKQEKV